MKLYHVMLGKATATVIMNVLEVKNAGRIFAVVILAGEEVIEIVATSHRKTC